MKRKSLHYIISVLLLAALLPCGVTSASDQSELYPVSLPGWPVILDVENKNTPEMVNGIDYRHLVNWTIEGPVSIHFIRVKIDEDFSMFSVCDEKASSLEKLFSTKASKGAIAGLIRYNSMVSDGSVQFLKPAFEKIPLGDLNEKIKNAGGFTALFENSSLLIKSSEICKSLPEKESPSTIAGIGITGEEKDLVIIMTEAGGEYCSIGLNQRQLAEYMSFLKCREAVCFYKKGRPAILGKIPGDRVPSVLNDDADLKGDLVSGVLITNDQSPGKAKRLIVSPESIIAFAGKPYALEVNLVDENGFLVDMTDVEISVSPQDAGSVDRDLIFRAGKNAARGYININSSGKKARVEFEIIDNILDIRTKPESLALLPDQKTFIDVYAERASGEEIMVPRVSVEWKVPRGLGRFTAPGKFLAASTEANGRITARILDKTTEAPVTVGKKVLAIPDFSRFSGWRIRASSVKIIANYEASISEINEKKTTVGWLRYDFTRAEANDWISLEKKMTLPGRPKAMRLLVKAPHTGYSLEGEYTDNRNKKHRVVFSDSPGWNDWRYLNVEIPPGTAYPITWKNLVIKNQSPKNRSGVSFFHNLEAIYPPEKQDVDVRLKYRNFPEWFSFQKQSTSPKKSDVRAYIFGNTVVSKFSPSAKGSLFLNRIIDFANENGGDFCLSTGNMTADSRAEQIEFVKNKFKRLKIPHYTTLGPSDIKGDPRVLNHPRFFNPTHYIRKFDDCALFVLDNSKGGFKVSDPHQKPIEDQWPWFLKELKSTNAPTLIISMALAPDFFEHPDKSLLMNSMETQILHRLLAREVKNGRHIVVFSGSLPGLGVRVIDDVPYINTGGAGVEISGSINSGGIYHFIELNISKAEISFAVRPFFTRLIMKRYPIKDNVAPGEELFFEGTMIWIDDETKKKEIFPLSDLCSYEWKVENPEIGKISPHEGVFQALSPGTAHIILDSGNYKYYEVIHVLEPGK